MESSASLGRQIRPENQWPDNRRLRYLTLLDTELEMLQLDPSQSEGAKCGSNICKLASKLKPFAGRKSYTISSGISSHSIILSVDLT